MTSGDIECACTKARLFAVPSLILEASMVQACQVWSFFELKVKFQWAGSSSPAYWRPELPGHKSPAGVSLHGPAHCRSPGGQVGRWARESTRPPPTYPNRLAICTAKLGPWLLLVLPHVELAAGVCPPAAQRLANYPPAHLDPSSSSGPTDSSDFLLSTTPVLR